MALVKVKQFFMSNENIAEEKRGSMYALYMTEVYAGKASKPQMIKGVGYAEEADLLAFCERHAPVDERSTEDGISTGTKPSGLPVSLKTGESRSL